jgi:rhodanese-related sulfurtransferase
MDKLIKTLNTKTVKEIRVSPDEFIEMYNKGEAILLDIRYPFETDKWGVNFSINIPLNELADRLSEIPKDKIIVCICPEEFRSNMACLYLRSKGFKSHLVTKGLLALTSRLRGGAAKDIQIS